MTQQGAGSVRAVGFSHPGARLPKSDVACYQSEDALINPQTEKRPGGSQQTSQTEICSSR